MQQRKYSFTLSRLKSSEDTVMVFTKSRWDWSVRSKGEIAGDEYVMFICYVEPAKAFLLSRLMNCKHKWSGLEKCAH